MIFGSKVIFCILKCIIIQMCICMYFGDIYIYIYIYGFSCSSVVKTLPANAGDAGDSGSIHGLGRFPGGGTDNPL